jgi:hypothetical protein
MNNNKPTLGLFNNNKPNSRFFFWKVRISRNFDRIRRPEAKFWQHRCRSFKNPLRCPPLSSLFEVAFRSLSPLQRPTLPFSSFPFDFFHSIQVIFSAFTIILCSIAQKKDANNVNNNITTITMVNTWTTLRSGVNNKLTLRPKVNVKQLYQKEYLPLPLWVNHWVQNQVVGIVCESRKNTSPYPFGSITEFKIKWWG